MATSLLIDGHVHFHAGFDLARFLDSCYANFSTLSTHFEPRPDWQGVLLLAEISPAHPLATLRKRVTQERTKWQVTGDGEDWLALQWPGGGELWFIAGRQIVTSERLEVLSLGSSAEIASGKPLVPTLSEVLAVEGIPVVPWGVGKWWGGRGRRLTAELLRLSQMVGSTQRVWLGDSYSRPHHSLNSAIWRIAAQAGWGCLPGTDPLAISAHESLAGRYGFSLPGQLTATSPLDLLKSSLSDLQSVTRLGRRTGWLPLIHDQWNFRRHRLQTPPTEIEQP